MVGLGLWRGRKKSRKKCGLEKEKKVDVNSMKRVLTSQGAVGDIVFAVKESFVAKAHRKWCFSLNSELRVAIRLSPV